MPEQVAPPPAPQSPDAPRPTDPPAAEGAEEPATEKPASEKPASEEPTSDKPTSEEPTSGKPATEKPTSAEPAADEATCAEPAAEGPAADEATSAEPAAEGPVAGATPPAGEDDPEADGSQADTGEAEQPETEQPETEQAEAEEPEPRRSAARKVLGVVAALLAVGVVAALKFGLGASVANALTPDGTAKAKAGDCLAELPDVAQGESRDARGAEVVACTSTEAVYTVVGRVDGQTEAEARTGRSCEQFLKPEQEGYFFYNIKPGSTGYLLCLIRRA
ncbi:LppU/SCO3897 family protein [Micromonospora okii]|uniref:LppU/SCO3897 family protein n=1 Tax=Micromonospora okii TaxID=1182970 RepID=UPI001E3FFAA7|nr:hypothetical protein [Micromonospora okii]